MTFCDLQFRNCVKYASLFAVVLVLAPPTMRSQTTGDPVMNVMQKWLDALQTRDLKTLELILGEEWIDNSRFGLVYTRKGFFSGPPNTPAASSQSQAARVTRHFEDTRVRLYGDVAIVTGTVVAKPADVESSGTAPIRTKFTDILVWRDGRWQAVSSQETAVPADKN
jgi:hypothetical protein